MRNFASNPSNAPEKQEAYKAKLAAMTDEELFAEAKDKIWLSAYAANNPISCFHWQCDATYDESTKRRNGNSEESIYSRAHKAAMHDAGY